MTQPPESGRGAAPADPPRTVVEARTVAEPREAPGAALPVGQALQEFVIEGLVGEGGFGIVYLARDTRLDRVVALKEYMPTNLAQRGSDRSVSVRSERYRETFVLGLRSFVNEAKLLASFDHPSLVKVYRFWEENGTAYMVMPFYEGPTLRQHLATLAQPPDEAWLRALLAPLIDALELIHNDHCWHRDIAPDNILLLAPPKQTQAGPGPQLRPLLLDFGAARRVIGDVTHNLTVILKPGYAPIEQYAESESMRQGAWTDVYALCAVLYCAITGRAPVPSVSRIISDDMVSAVQAGAGRYSPAFLGAIDAGLAVRPDARPQSMAQLRERFDIGPARSPQSPAAAPRETAPAPAKAPSAQGAPKVDARAAVAGSAPAMRRPASAGADPREARSRASSGETARKWPLMVAGFVVLVAAAASFGWWLERSTTARRAPVQASPASPQQTPHSGAQIAQPETPSAAAPVPTQSEAASAVLPVANPVAAQAASAASAGAPAPGTVPVAAPGPAPAVKVPAVASPAKVVAPAAAAVAARPAAPRASAAGAPALTLPAGATPARTAAPSTTAPPATAQAQPPPAAVPPTIDTKRFECDVLVRAGQKALANRSYDDAMQRADEASAVFPDCPGAAELGRNARQAKDRARSSAVIQ